MNKCRNNGIKSVCGRVWSAFAAQVDWIAIVASLAAIVLILVAPNSAGWSGVLRVVSNLLALLGAGYWLYAIWLFLCRKVEFDHHLINGHFLRKVISLSLLTPFVITSLMSVFYLSEPSVSEQVFAEGAPVESIEFDPYEDDSLLWAVLSNFLDPGNQHLASNKSGRAWGMLIAVLGMILLNGLLISSLISAIDRRKERWMDGDIVYSPRQLGRGKYAIVLGANEIAASVVKNLLAGHNSNDLNFKCESDNRYVVLQTNRNPSEVRAELRAHLAEDEADKVIVCGGLRNSKEELSGLGVEYASEIYVLGESSLMGGGESFHDAVSMQCINILADLLEVGRPKREALKAKRLAQGRHYAARKVCKVLFEYQTTNSVLMFSDLPSKVKANLVIIPFNRYESWARKVVVEGEYTYPDRLPIKYTFLDGAKGITDVNSPEYVHLVIVGMSKMGMALGLQAMLEAHYINYAKARTRITFIDTAADKEMNFFKGRYSNLFGLMRHRYFDANEKVVLAGGNEIYGQHCATDWIDPIECADSKWSHLTENGKNFLDVEVEFVKGELESEGVRSYLEYMTEDKNSKLTIAICLTQSHQAIAASLYMPVCVYSKVQQVWVYQPDSQDIIYNQAHTEQRDFRYDKLVPFGMLYGEYVCDRSQYLQAMLVNIQYDLMAKEKGEGWAAGAQSPATLLDKMEKGYAAARESWKKLIVYKKLSNRYYADSIALKIRSVTTPENATLSLAERLEQYAAPLAECEHNRWTMQELLLGFSPCDKELDDLMRRNENGEDVTEDYKAWKKRNNLADNSFRKIKDDMKECALRIHPNICDFDHLARIDAGAQPYDAYLNKAIPKILELVKSTK